MAQTLTEIRSVLQTAGLRPQKMFGQNFLIDQNLLRAVVGFAEVAPGDGVLEVGPGTGTLTDELLAAGAKVLAVEIDRGLAALLRQRYAGAERLRLLECDALAGKHRINPAVLDAAGELPQPVALVANLPYNIATPLLVECLLLSARAARQPAAALGFQRLTVTVQQEVAHRLAAGPKDELYGPTSVLTSLLGRVSLGKVLPAAAFWPRPTVTSQMIRIDAVPPAVADVPDLDILQDVVRTAFAHRRKKLGSACRPRDAVFSETDWREGLVEAGISGDDRPDAVDPDRYRRLATALAEARRETNR